MCDYSKKYKFVTAALPETEWIFSYSAVQLQEELNKRLAGQKIKKIYVDLEGYLESVYIDPNGIDLTMGGDSLIILERDALQLIVHVEGMIEYRWIPTGEIQMQTHYDYPPMTLGKPEKYLFDLSNYEFKFNCCGSTVHHVSVKGTNTWAFPLEDFDESIAAEAAQKGDLPASIILHTDCCNVIFLGDSIEYSYVIFEEN